MHQKHQHWKTNQDKMHQCTLFSLWRDHMRTNSCSMCSWEALRYSSEGCDIRTYTKIEYYENCRNLSSRIILKCTWKYYKPSFRFLTVRRCIRININHWFEKEVYVNICMSHGLQYDPRFKISTILLGELIHNNTANLDVGLWKIHTNLVRIVKTYQKHFIVNEERLPLFFFLWRSFYAVIKKVRIKCNLPSDAASLMYFLNFCSVHASVSNFVSTHCNLKLPYQKLLIYIFSHLSTVFWVKLQSSVSYNRESLCSLIIQVIYNLGHILSWCTWAELHWFRLHYAHTGSSRIRLFKKLHCGNKFRVADTAGRTTKYALQKIKWECGGFFVCSLLGLSKLGILWTFSCRVEVLVVIGQQMFT